MAEAALDRTVPPQAELPVTAYPHHHHIFQSPAGGVPTGLLFDSKSYAVMAISQEPKSQTPDVNVDKDGDRVLVLLDGDLALQIGEKRFKMQPGDAVQIPRGVAFGRTGSQAGAHLLLIRAKAFRSFTMYR
jgi:quercetin dioxygenase-like cupin family protein